MSTEIVSPRLRLPEVRQILKCSTSYVYALARRGVLRRYSSGPRFAFWRREEVLAVAEGRDPYAAEATQADNQATKKPAHGEQE